jgi:hypothetical protein
MYTCFHVVLKACNAPTVFIRACAKNTSGFSNHAPKAHLWLLFISGAKPFGNITCVLLREKEVGDEVDCVMRTYI